MKGFTYYCTIEPKQRGFRTPFGRAMTKLINKYQFGVMWGFLHTGPVGIRVTVFFKKPTEQEQVNFDVQRLLYRWAAKGVVKV